MLVLENLKHAYENTPIVYPNWRVAKREHALILGNSGSGKTTLLHLICGLMPPTEGDIWIDDLNISKLNKSALDRYRGSHIGIVFQQAHLIKSLSVMENLQLAGYLSGKKIPRTRYDRLLEELDMGELRNRKVHKLSQGQAQRVSIGRAVVHDPVLLAADEPTSSLDDTNCKHVIRLLKRQADEHGATLLIVTHDQRLKGEFSNQLQL